MYGVPRHVLQSGDSGNQRIGDLPRRPEHGIGSMSRWTSLQRIKPLAGMRGPNSFGRVVERPR